MADCSPVVVSHFQFSRGGGMTSSSLRSVSNRSRASGFVNMSPDKFSVGILCNAISPWAI